MSVWMGGVPDCYLLTNKGSHLESIQSQHLPLGVLKTEQFNDDMTEHSMDIEDRFFMWSDGIVEARNSQGEMFGEERLRSIFSNDIDPNVLFDAVQKSINEFVGETEKDDDTTLVELKMVDDEAVDQAVSSRRSSSVASDWKIDYELGADSLRNFNPLPLVMHIMMEVPILRVMGGQLFTVVSELFSNALEHGLLTLDSAMKSTPAGFAEFYAVREQRLTELQSGFIKIQMQHTSKNGRTGIFKLSIEDSGEGFNYKKVSHEKALEIADNTSEKNIYSGRGLPLINALCHSLEYVGCGNKVVAEIHWPQKNKV